MPIEAIVASLALGLSPDKIEGPNPYGALTTWPVALVIIGVLGILAWWATRSPRSRRRPPRA